MKELKEWLEKAKNRYLEARELIEVTSLQDSVTRPYKSKYEAQAILESIGDQLKELDYDDAFDCDPHLNAPNLIKVLTRLELGIIAVETEETGIGEKLLASARTLAGELFTGSVSVVLYEMNILNQLGYLWSCFGEYEKSCQALTVSEEAYRKWTLSEPKTRITLDFVDAFEVNPQKSAETRAADAEKKVEKTFTQTLYFMAQVYEKLGKNNEAAIYCHQTLKRQYLSKEFDPIDWAINAATLSQFFAVNDDFESARHHLACAHFVLNNHSCDFGDEDEKVKQSKADLARICTKYSLMLFEASKAPKGGDELNLSTTEDFRSLINESKVAEIEMEIRAQLVSGFEEARALFLKAQQWSNSAKEYYSLDEHASDYVECIQDQSKLFRLLCYFETDQERKCKMHKRRVDLLEALLKEINPQYFLVQTRQMIFELAETYSEMVDIKLTLMEEKPDTELAGSAKKINILIIKAIQQFEAFVDTFKVKSTNALPDTFGDEMVKPVLVAYFSVGRLHTKIYTTDPRDQLKNWNACDAYYKKVVDYVERNPQHKELVSEELTLVQEMLQLIPGKLNLVMNTTVY